MKIAAYGILFGMIVLAIVQHALYWPHLPDRVASHFGADGQPDGWMSRMAFTMLMVGIQIGMPLFLTGIGWLVGLLPASMVNIPNRQYWLHPDRHAATVAYMRIMMVWIAIAMSIFMATIAHLMYLANRNDGSLNETLFLVALGVFIAAVFGFLGYILWRFRLPGDAVKQ